MQRFLDDNRENALALFRIVLALLFLQHGSQKLLGVPPSPEGMPPFLSLLGIGGALELAGGAMIALGLLTRPVAFLLCGEMAVAYWLFHAPSGPFPASNGGDAAILFCFGFLLLVFMGPGSFSLDANPDRRHPAGTTRDQGD